MNYYQSCAAKGDYSGGQATAPAYPINAKRAAVNVYKTENSFEMLVFAPGRFKENFSLNVKGNELTITYTPPEGIPRPDWIMREYSRGGFVRTFTLDDNVDTKGISAKYVDGVLQVSLPIVAGKESTNQEIKVS